MINPQRLAIVVTVVNLVLLFFVLSHDRVAEAQGNTRVLRAQGLELVDARGQVRAELSVEPDGEVLFRMRDAAGTIRVKLSAGAHGSGLLLIDEATEPGVQIIARRAATSNGPTTTRINLAPGRGKPNNPRASGRRPALIV